MPSLENQLVLDFFMTHKCLELEYCKLQADHSKINCSFFSMEFPVDNNRTMIEQRMQQTTIDRVKLSQSAKCTSLIPHHYDLYKILQVQLQNACF